MLSYKISFIFGLIMIVVIIYFIWKKLNNTELLTNNICSPYNNYNVDTLFDNNINNPRGITIDGSGNLFYIDDNTIIRKLIILTGEISTIAGAPPVPPTGNELLTPSKDGVGVNARFYAIGITTDNSGNLFITDFTSIKKIVISTGLVTTIAGDIPSNNYGYKDGIGNNAMFRELRGITYDGSGNLFVCDGNNSIRKINIDTKDVSTIAGPRPTNGEDFVSRRRYKDGIGTNARFSQPYGIVKDGIGTNARFSQPYGIVCDNSGNLFVTDLFNNSIRKINISTRLVTTIAGTPPSDMTTQVSSSNQNLNKQYANNKIAKIIRPTGIVYDGCGNLFVIESNNHCIKKIVISTKKISIIAGSVELVGYKNGNGNKSLFNILSGITIDSVGKILYVTDKGNKCIRKISLIKS